MSLHYVLDGYNIINQVQFAGLRLKDRRENLTRFIETFRPQGSRKNKVTVVFDGKEDVFSPPVRSEIKVIFTRNESADDWIKRFVEKTAQPKQCLVVTDDKEIRFFVRAFGAKVVSVSEFVDKVRKKFQPTKTEETPLSLEKAREITKELEKIWLKGV